MVRAVITRAAGRALLVAAAAAALSACGADGDPARANDATVGADLQPGRDLAPADGRGAPDGPATDSELQQLAAWMTGRFSSAQQATQDPSYLHITLDMKRIWPGRSDGYWLYVEQAMAGSLPYRQRVYRLQRLPDSTFSSGVFEFASTAEESKAVGAFKQAKPLAHLTDKDLVEKQGCAVLLSLDAKAHVYSGATKPKSCLSDYNGASYTASDVQISSSKLSSWDRGFDSSDQQVWGAVKGPYVFDKLQDLDPDLTVK